MNLPEFFVQNPSGALAFSGGTDSSLLVWAAAKYGQNWRAYYVHSAFQPAFELADAHQIAAACGLPMAVIEADILQHQAVIENPPNRCYFCKQAIFSAICRRAAADGCALVIDGSNASDDAEDRPGMRALKELNVRSPLRECGLTKSDVRALSRQAGLFTWDKPSYACLATRIPTGTPITSDALQKVEQGEQILAALGFRDFRIRLHGRVGIIQITEAQFCRAWELRSAIQAALAPLFPLVTLDLLPRTGN